MKLINVDDIGLTDFEIIMCDDYKEVLTMLCQKIDNAKEAIVRCKNCKHYKYEATRCLTFNAPMREDGFCSHEKRRTDGKTN